MKLLRPAPLLGLSCLIAAMLPAHANRSVSYSVPIVIQAKTDNSAQTGAPQTEIGNDGPLDLTESMLDVALGSQRIIALRDLPARVALADPDVAEVTVLKPVQKGGRGAGLLVVGKQVGTSSLLVWSKGNDKPVAYTLAVTGAPVLPLNDIAGLNVQTKGNAVKLSGTVDHVAAYQQAKEKLIKSSIGGKPVEVTDNTTLATPGTVQVDVKVVEFSRNDIQRLGISFTKTNGNLTFGFGNPATAATGSAVNQALSITYNRTDPSALMTQLNALESEGVARVLAEPTLVAQSGQSASFLAGGEIPIPVPSGAASATGTFTIQFKEFGIRLNFTPTILSKRTIALKVAPEVSDLDRNNGVVINGFNIPAILTRRAETTVELGEGESFVIGGLISRNVTSNLRKFPVLADLPVLGAFFRSVEYEKQDKELLIIATPRFVKPRAKNAPSLALPGNQASDVKPGWGQMFLPSRDGSLPGFSR
jgi:pilus assembly protein CpaC